MLHVLAILAATFGTVATDSPATQWQSDYAVALKQTRADDRPLLVVIDQPGDSEQALSAELLEGRSLADYDLCRIDASTKYGKKVADAFKTTAFPYVAFIDKSGSVILHSHTGTLSDSKWNGLVGKYRTGEKPVRHVVAKPVIHTMPVSTSMPATQVYDNYQPYYPSARPYCAKCQRGY